MREKGKNDATTSMNTPRRTVATTNGVTIKAGKENGSVWRRMKSSAFSKLGGKREI